MVTSPLPSLKKIKIKKTERDTHATTISTREMADPEALKAAQLVLDSIIAPFGPLWKSSSHSGNGYRGNNNMDKLLHRVMHGLSPVSQLRAAAVLSDIRCMPLFLGAFPCDMGHDVSHVAIGNNGVVDMTGKWTRTSNGKAFMSWICRGAIGYSSSERDAFFSKAKPRSYDTGEDNSRMYMRIVDSSILGTQRESTNGERGTFWGPSLMERNAEHPTFYIAKNIPGEAKEHNVGTDSCFYSPSEYPTSLGPSVDACFKGTDLMTPDPDLSKDAEVSIDMGDVMAKAVKLSGGAPFPIYDATETLDDAVNAATAMRDAMDTVPDHMFLRSFGDYVSRPCYVRRPGCNHIPSAVVSLTSEGHMARMAGHRLLTTPGVDLRFEGQQHQHFSSHLLGDPLGYPSRSAQEFTMGNKYLKEMINAGARHRADASGLKHDEKMAPHISQYPSYQRFPRHDARLHTSAREFCKIVDECRMVLGIVPMASGISTTAPVTVIPSCFIMWARGLKLKLFPHDDVMSCPLLTHAEAATIGCSSMGSSLGRVDDPGMLPFGYCESPDSDALPLQWPQAFCGSAPFNFGESTDDLPVSINGQEYIIPVNVVAEAIRKATVLFQRMHWATVTGISAPPPDTAMGTLRMLDSSMRAYACDTARTARGLSDRTGINTGHVKDSFRLRSALASLPPDVIVIIMDHVMEFREGSPAFPRKELEHYEQCVAWAKRFPTCESPGGEQLTPESVLETLNPMHAMPLAVTYQSNLYLTQRECGLIYKLGHEALVEVAESEGRGAVKALGDMNATKSRPTDFPATNLAISLLLPCTDGKDTQNWKTYGTIITCGLDSDLHVSASLNEGLESRDLSKEVPRDAGAVANPLSMMFSAADTLKNAPVHIGTASNAQKAALLCIRQSVDEMLGNVPAKTPQNGKDEVEDAPTRPPAPHKRQRT